MHRAGWLVIALAGAGCQTSYLVGRGDDALARHAPKIAVADYAAALERRVTEHDREEVTGRRDRAALALAEEEIAAAIAERDAGQLDEARTRLWRILAAGAWGAPAARSAILEALERIDRPRWSELEALGKAGRFIPAVEAASVLVTPYPEGHPMRVRLADLLQRAQAHHLELAAAADDDVMRWFNQRIAITLGAPAPASFAELERAVRARAGYAWEVHLDATSCPSLARVLEKQQATGEQSAEVVFESCRESDRSWSEHEHRTYTDAVPQVRFTEEPYWEAERDPACDPDACLRYDELGVCLERPPEPEKCRQPERRLVVRQVPVIEFQEVAKPIEVEVLHRKIEMEAHGIVRFGGAEPQPFRVEDTAEDQAFWSPDQSRRFGGIDAAGSADRLFAKLKESIDRRVAEVRAASGSALGEHAEAQHVLAAVVAHTVPPEAAGYFESAYGMSPADVLAALGLQGTLLGAATPPPPYELPMPEVDPELDRFEYGAVVRQERVRGLALLAETGVDLAVTGGSTPFQTARTAFGLAARLRVSRLHVGASGWSTALGGGVSGFSLSMTGLSLDLGKAGFFVGFGLSYAQESTDAGERYRIFAVPLIVRVPLATWLWLGASFEPNLLFAKTIFDDSEGDPHFWSPVRAWATVDLFQRVYLSAAAAHHLGAGFSKKPVQVELTVGVRL